MNLLPVIINIVVFLAILFLLYTLGKNHVSFNIRVLIGMVLGVAFGIAMQLIYGVDSGIIKETNNWIGVVGTGYTRLLRLIVIPLIFVSIAYSISSQTSKNLGKMAGSIIGILLITVAISATVGGLAAKTFNLNPITIESGTAEKDRGTKLEADLKSFQARSIQDQILDVIPTNPFYSLTGQGSSSTLSVVFFAALVGIAVVGIRKKKADSAEFFEKMLSSSKDVVMRIVALILRLTPYGVLAIMAKVLSTSKFAEISKLLTFLLVSYLAILIMFIIHAVLLSVFGLNPVKFFKKATSTLVFAFTSRSSAATVPLTSDTLTAKMGVNEGYASLAASLGTTIGQNGCAGIYPAMLAVMIASAEGIPFTFGWFLKLIIITAISSIGIAGVGGGATFSALAVLSGMGLPVGLVGVLISIEPLIDMARTSLNVSDSMLSGLIASKLDKQIDMDVYNKNQDIIIQADKYMERHN